MVHTLRDTHRTQTVVLHLGQTRMSNRISLLIFSLIISCNPQFKSSIAKSESEHDTEMQELIKILQKDINLHEKVERVISSREIRNQEKKLGIRLPDSYKKFLKEFGNGANSLYHVDQPINGIDTKYGGIHWLGKYRNSLGNEIQSDGFGAFQTNSLLCLMTENSNGGAWVWLTSEYSDNGEWPLAFFIDGKLYYKVKNFKEWVRLATQCKGEVIRELDKVTKLNLG